MDTSTHGYATTYAKIVGKNHNDYEYKLGLNVLLPGEQFSVRTNCGPGGLYFCNVVDVLAWLDRGDTLCIVQPGEGAPVVPVMVGNHPKYKTDRLLVTWMMSLSDVRTWKYLVDKCGVDVRSENASFACWAASRGYLQVLKYLVEDHGADVSSYDQMAVCRSAWGGHLSVVKYLIEECKVDVHAREDGALRWAAKGGHLDMVKYLVKQRGADVHAREDNALYWAADENHLDLVKYLVEQCGANVHVRNDYLFSRTFTGLGHSEVIEYLNEYSNEYLNGIRDTFSPTRRTE